MTTQASLALVRTRLNRATGQRALYWILGAALLAVAAAAAAASRLPAEAFRFVLAGLAAWLILVAMRAIARLRAAWAGEVAAARWVENHVALDERLLTYACARPAERESHLWPRLAADNERQLPRWAGARLGIPRVPANVAFFILALVAAALSLVPSPDAPQPPPEVLAQERGQPAADGDSQGAGGAGGLVQGAKAGGSEGSSNGHPAAPIVITSVEGLRASLAERFDQSVAASVLGQQDVAAGNPPENPNGDSMKLASAPNAERGGLGQTKAEEGGRPPDASMARLERDDGSGQAVQKSDARAGGKGGGRSSSPGAEGSAESGSRSEKSAGGAPRPAGGGRGKPDGPLVNGDAAGNPTGGTGGAGAGSGKGTGPLLAAKPLTLDGGRQTARFALTIGAGSRDGAPDDKGTPTQPRSHIADGARGAQVADQSVRHEEIPAEYEGIVKRIFAREP